MNSRPVAQKKTDKGLFGILEPLEAWTAILGLIFMIILFLIAVPQLLVPLFPLASLLVAIFLYSRYPVLYVGFSWWMWFLAPFVRRLIDYRCSAVTFSSYHLTSMLVASVCGVTVYKKLLNSYRTGGIPFILCFGSVFYAFVVAFVRQTNLDFGQIITNAMGWFAPMMLGFYVYTQWREYPAFRDNFQKVFLWFVIVTGSYGVFQFVVAPEWDRFALIQAMGGMVNASWTGVPEPFGIRVWSTMSNPFTFALNMMPGLILLFISKSKLRYLATGVGYLSFLLSKSRTGWYSYLISLFIFFFSIKSKFQIRLFVTVASILLIVLPLATVEPFSGAISDRMQMVTGEIEDDHSYRVRMEQFNEGIDHALQEYLGWGLMGIQGIPTGFDLTGQIKSVTSGLDNGYLVVVVSLGWLGLIPYATGLGMMLYRLFSAPPSQLDLVAVAARATIVGSIIRMITTNITTGEFATPIWGCLGIAMAAQKYYSTKEKVAKIASHSSTSYN